MVAAMNLARIVGPITLAVLVIYNLSVQMFGVPTPRPWNFLLAFILTLPLVLWLGVEVAERRSNRHRDPMLREHS